MNSLNCNVIKDLLPLYVDDLSSEESTQLVEEHLAGCAQCRQLADTLKADVKFSAKDTDPELDYLKKVRSKRKRLLFVTIALSALVFGTLLVAGVKTYIIGSPVSFYSIDYNRDDEYIGIGTEFNAETGELTIYGELLDERLEVSGVKLELDKTLADAYNVTVYGVPRLFASKQRKGSFRESLNIPDNNERWTVYSMGDSPHDVVMFWSNGELLMQKYADAQAALMEYLTVNNRLSLQSEYIEWAYYGQDAGESCHVFYIIDNREGVGGVAVASYAVSEDCKRIYLYDEAANRWQIT